MRMRIGLALLVVVSLTFLIAAATGRLSGVITDRSGSVVPGVRVTVAGPQRASTVTDRQGRYRFLGLLPGQYTVTAELLGFNTAQSALEVKEGAEAKWSPTIEVASLAESSVVTGAPPGADKPETHEGSAGRLGVRVAGAAGGLAFFSPDNGPSWRGARPPREGYAPISENPFRRVAADPLSTFSIDVDTASYANMRRFLTDGTLPPLDAVRIEEFINYFRFEYREPAGNQPFSVSTELAACPWNPSHHLALIGLQGRPLPAVDTPPRNLVFLLDVSGSMQPPDKLPLVQASMRMLTDTLRAQDRVAIVVYAGASGLVLPPTAGDRKADIHRAIAGLHAGGSTNGAAGIQLAYATAREHFNRDGINRVILATDGDFNVGITSHEELLRLIERERKSGVFLSVLGVGEGNLQDATMELLADKGNGNYSYLDSVQEANKVLVREAASTLVTIAKDVKVQVEFNPAAVSAYRLVGYENRMLQSEDFNDDRKDAGEIGAGHTVTAIYEIVPVGAASDGPAVDPLKYQPNPTPPSPPGSSVELLTVKLRHKAPDGDRSDLISAVILNRVQPMGANLGFASAVAELGMLLRDSLHAPDASFDRLIARARSFRGTDPDGDRAEFEKLAEVAAGLKRLEGR
jgi:Ca-activated chloride channel family protein